MTGQQHTFLSDLLQELRRVRPDAFIELPVSTDSHAPDVEDSASEVKIGEYSTKLCLGTLKKVASHMKGEDVVEYAASIILKDFDEYVKRKATSDLSFHEALDHAVAGEMISREGWTYPIRNNGCPFVFMQVPSVIPASTIPHMTSLPKQVKQELMSRDCPLHYSDQLAIVHGDNVINGYSPSVSDIFAKDWYVWPRPTGSVFPEQVM